MIEDMERLRVMVSHDAAGAGAFHVTGDILRELFKDRAIVDFIEAKRDDWVGRDAYGEPYLVAHTWEVEKDTIRIMAQRNTFREAVEDEMRAEAEAKPMEVPNEDLPF